MIYTLFGAMQLAGVNVLTLLHNAWSPRLVPLEAKKVRLAVNRKWKYTHSSEGRNSFTLFHLVQSGYALKGGHLQFFRGDSSEFSSITPLSLSIVVFPIIKLSRVDD